MDRRNVSAATSEHSVADRLGWAMYVIFGRGCYMEYPIAALKMWLLPPAKLSQLHLFVDSGNKLLGYMTWAWFSAETEQRWKAQTLETIHISEWNEGDRLWIIDFVTLPGYTELCLKLAPLAFPEGTVAYSLSRRVHDPSVATIEWTRVRTGRRNLRRRTLRVKAQ